MGISKTFLTVTTLAVAAMLGGGAYVMMNMGSLAQKITERVASDTLGVGVEIGSMNVSLQERKAVVSNLSVANPPGFKKPYAVTVDMISIDLGALTKGLITFEDITVRGTNVNVEVKEATTNLQVIKSNLKTKPSKKPVAGEEPMKVIIDRFEMSEANLHPSVTLLGGQDLGSVVVPNIVLSGIGQKENGIVASDAIAQIWRHLSGKFSAAASSAGFYQGMSVDALKDLGVSQANQITDQVGKKLKGFFQ